MQKRFQRYIVLSGVIGLATIIAGASTLFYQRYFANNLSEIALVDEPESTSDYSGEKISFEQIEGMTHNVSATMQNGGSEVVVTLKDIDLGLWIPTVPEAIQDNAQLERLFLSEREFNRQRVVFAAGSPHIEIQDGSGLDAKNISVNLTNNCLGSGRWEFAVFEEQNGEKTKIYQGYFSFPLGSYRQLVETANGTSYWQQARSMEAWPGFNFFSGTSFDLEATRSVDSEYEVVAVSRDNDPILAADEQESKTKLIVHSSSEQPLKTWQDLRSSDVQFQSFVSPGIYDETQLWNTNFSEIANFSGAVVRQISSNLSDEPLQEIELTFQNEAGEDRTLVVSGLKLEDLPQLATNEYYKGLYRPLGFGTPFTQDYEELKQNPPSESPLFSFVLDEEGRLMNYRKEIGINGVVMYRDIDRPERIHIHPLSYERIMLVGHYVVDLNGEASATLLSAQ
ncbi:MAG: hypothetical protein HC899_08715 [Leptolyngbyaceae cyanobacterium SM1_4_3]|nr:hypothetical protein [Leptolyngbyaceae cyanobacterium SM1_4_3]